MLIATNRRGGTTLSDPRAGNIESRRGNPRATPAPRSIVLRVSRRSTIVDISEPRGSRHGKRRTLDDRMDQRTQSASIRGTLLHHGIDRVAIGEPQFPPERVCREFFSQAAREPALVPQQQLFELTHIGKFFSGSELTAGIDFA